jgi:hypothetical protein
MKALALVLLLALAAVAHGKITKAKIRKDDRSLILMVSGRLSCLLDASAVAMTLWHLACACRPSPSALAPTAGLTLLCLSSL